MDTDTLLQRITADPKIFGGKPIIRGMRISVELVLSQLAQGETMEAILEDYPELEREDMNVDEEAFDTFDLGAKRGFQLVLADRGETYAATLAAALKWVWLQERGRLHVKSDQPTPSELDDVLQRNPDIRESLRFANKLRNFLPPALAAVCHYWCATKGKREADKFFESLADGLRMEATNPIYVLREKLRKERASTRVEASELERMAWVLKAWNAVRDERSVRNLTWRNRGPGAEPFPAVL